MGITVYGRRTIRRLERETGERIVHAAGTWITTVDHRHLEWSWAGDAACPPTPAPWRPVPCPGLLASCRLLFGMDQDGRRRHFMRGACDRCSVEPEQPHRHDCPVLVDLLAWPSINPDYWPVPVHRPRWMDRWKTHVAVQDSEADGS